MPEFRGQNRRHQSMKWRQGREMRWIARCHWWCKSLCIQDSRSSLRDVRDSGGLAVLIALMSESGRRRTRMSLGLKPSALHSTLTEQAQASRLQIRAWPGSWKLRLYAWHPEAATQTAHQRCLHFLQSPENQSVRH